MIALLIIFAFVATGLGIWLVALTSPTGYEDESGFHFGIQQKVVLQKSAKRATTRPRAAAKIGAKKTVERKSPARNRRPAATWKTADPLADQLKFPFPATH